MADRDPVRTLVRGDNAFPYHRFEEARPILESFLGDAPGIEPAFTTDPDDLRRDALSGYDVVVDYGTDHRFTDAQREGLVGFVREGGGLVGVHGAADFQREDDPAQAELEALLGGAFVDHPDLTELSVEMVDADHPITAGIDDFAIEDEPYELRYDPGVRILAETRHEAFGEMPVAWTKRAGDGRVFYDANGHDERALTHPAFQALVTRGIRWAAGEA